MYEKAFECCTSKAVEQCKECPLCAFGYTQLDCKTELLRKIKSSKIYEVMVRYAGGDGVFTHTYIYATEKDARRLFNSEIIEAMQYYDVFDEKTGELISHYYELEKGDNHWELWTTGCYNQVHCLITLTEKEIH